MAYWIGMGDYGEFITPHDPRWDGGVIAGWLSPDNIAYDLVNHIYELISPIKDKCIGLLYGNHEDAIKKHNHDNVQKMLCDKLGVTDLGYSAFVRFQFLRGRKSTFNNRTYIGYFTHGSGCAVTAGAKLIRLQRTMDNFDADILAHGHVHDILVYEKPYLKLDNANQVKSRTKVAAMTGCYFRTYTQGKSASYGETKGYSPVAIGSPVFLINPDDNILRVENG